MSKRKVCPHGWDRLAYCQTCQKRQRTTYLYVIDGPHAVKVGITNEPEKRLRDLQYASGHPDLTIVRSWETSLNEAERVERLAHEILLDYHIGCGEWFACHPLEAVAAVELAIRDKGRHSVSRSPLRQAA